MKLEKWALIAEIVGGLAIVVTLIVLIAEVRGNTGAVRAQTSYALYLQERERRNRLIENTGGILEIRIRARAGESLSEIEEQQYGIYSNDLLDHFQWQYREVQAGRLSEDFIDTRVWSVVWWSNAPGLPGAYDVRKLTLDPGFVEFLERSVIPNNPL